MPPLRAAVWMLASPVAMNYLDDIVGAKEYAAGKATALAGVKVIDDTHIAITITAPRSYFLGKLTFPTAYALDKTEVEKGEKIEGAFTITATNVVGSGPYKLGSYVRQGKVILDANADYWAGAPKLKKIERPIILDAKTARNRYDAGQLDIVTLEKGDYERDKADAKVSGEIQTFGRAATFYLGLNQTHYAPFKDKRVRQAFYQAIDIATIQRVVMRGASTPTALMIGPGINGFQTDAKRLPYDVEAAKKLLAEAGYPNGFEVAMNCPNDRYVNDGRICQTVAANLSRINVKINLQAETKGTYFPKILRRDTSFYMLGWTPATYDSHNALNALVRCVDDKGAGQFNLGAYCNPKVDELTLKIQSETDKAKRNAMIKEAFDLHAADVGHIPLHQQALAWGVNKNVKLVQLADNFMPFKWMSIEK